MLATQYCMICKLVNKGSELKFKFSQINSKFKFKSIELRLFSIVKNPSIPKTIYSILLILRAKKGAIIDALMTLKHL